MKHRLKLSLSESNGTPELGEESPVPSIDLSHLGAASRLHFHALVDTEFETTTPEQEEFVQKLGSYLESTMSPHMLSELSGGNEGVGSAITGKIGTFLTGVKKSIAGFFSVVASIDNSLEEIDKILATKQDEAASPEISISQSASRWLYSAKSASSAGPADISEYIKFMELAWDPKQYYEYVRTFCLGYVECRLALFKAGRGGEKLPEKEIYDISMKFVAKPTYDVAVKMQKKFGLKKTKYKNSKDQPILMMEPLMGLSEFRACEITANALSSREFTYASLINAASSFYSEPSFYDVDFPKTVSAMSKKQITDTLKDVRKFRDIVKMSRELETTTRQGEAIVEEAFKRISSEKGLTLAEGGNTRYKVRDLSEWLVVYAAENQTKILMHIASTAKAMLTMLTAQAKNLK